MPYNLESYNQVKHTFIQSSVGLGSMNLTGLVDYYSIIINSRRRSANIKSLNELITILEKRSFISESNIVPLKQIASSFTDCSQFQSAVTIHERIMNEFGTHRIFFNSYDPRNQPAFFSGPTAQQYEVPHFPPDVRCSTSSASCRLQPINSFHYIPKPVVELISQEIGRSWKELARKLSVKEGEIDSITEKYPRDTREQAREVLKVFQQKTDPDKILLKLVGALEEARRSDLKEEVQEILNRRNP